MRNNLTNTGDAKPTIPEPNINANVDFKDKFQGSYTPSPLVAESQLGNLGFEKINVGEMERTASNVVGGILGLYAIKKIFDGNFIVGATTLATAAGLVFRGSTGHCPMYDAAGINTHRS